MCEVFFFFFSSRRRHTRWNCDWSSDVCSSDLGAGEAPGRGRNARLESPGPQRRRRAVGKRPLTDDRVGAREVRVAGEALGDATRTVGGPRRTLSARLEDHVVDPDRLAVPAARPSQREAPAQTVVTEVA